MNSNINFSPDNQALRRIKDGGGFRLLCQNMMPELSDGKYDYKDILSEIVKYLNDNIAATAALAESFDNLQDYTDMMVHPYFFLVKPEGEEKPTNLYVKFGAEFNEDGDLIESSGLPSEDLGRIIGERGPQGERGEYGSTAALMAVVTSFDWNIGEDGILRLGFDDPDTGEHIVQQVGQILSLEPTDVSLGGTGASTPEMARVNLGITLENLGVTISETPAPATGTPGSIYLQML